MYIEIQRSVLYKLTYRFNTNLIKILTGYMYVCVCDINKLILKFTWRRQGPRTTKTILKLKNKIRRLVQLDCKTYCKTVVITKQ